MDLNTSMSMPILFNFDCFQGLHRTQLGIGKSPVETRIVMTGCWFDSSIALELVGIFLDHFESINGH